MFYLMPIIIYLPVGIYLYHFFKYFLSLFHIGEKIKITRSLSVTFAILCAIWGWRIYGLGAVIVLHFFAVCVIVELLGLLMKHIVKKPGFTKRCDFICRSGILSVLIVSFIMGYGFYNMKQVKATNYALDTDKELEQDLKIAQISDLHMGTTMSVEKLKEYCAQIESQDPDILALTGDIFDERTTRQEMEAASEILSEVETTYGIYYVFGNHDYNTYISKPFYTEAELRQSLEDNGIHVLEDRAVEAAPGLLIAGRKDFSVERKEIGQMIPKDTGESFVLLLDHQPVDLQENSEAGVHLQLSGHTHAGQIWPTGQLGQLAGIVEQNYGLKKIGNYHIIVSSGIAGWGYPIRTGGHSEYVIIDVKVS